MDNQGKPAEMADQSGAHSAGLKNPEDVHELCDKCSHAADCWGNIQRPRHATKEHDGGRFARACLEARSFSHLKRPVQAWPSTPGISKPISAATVGASSMSRKPWLMRAPTAASLPLIKKKGFSPSLGSWP